MIMFAAKEYYQILNYFMKRVLLFVFLFFPTFLVLAQKSLITGTVREKGNNDPLPGVSILEKGTTNGTITGSNGEFQLSANQGATLVFSFIGMKTQEVMIGNETTLSVAMEPFTEEINDVVVTALGIKREKKVLGYSVQDVGSSEISGTNPNNVVSALSGKIAGAQVVTSSGQVGSSSTIKIRGNKSFTGSAEPLFVVDGTPVMNTITSAMTSDTYTDFGNAAMDIDPSNIASISVLKGASASALYGSRAANGVILISTKRGIKRKGMGVEVSSSVAMDKVWFLPDFQDEYGQGRDGSEYEWKTNYPGLTYQEFADQREFRWDLNGKGNRMDWDESWGTRLDVGLMVPQMDSPVDGQGNVTPTPWISHPNNVKDFFETGITWNNSIALSGGNDIATGRLTLSRVDQTGISPNTSQTHNNVGVNTSVKLTDHLSFDANITYSELNNDNLPEQGNNMRNPMLEFNGWFGRQIDMNYLKEHYQDIVTYKGAKKAFNWMMDFAGQHNNPYWIAYKNTMSRNRKRSYGNVSINYKILPGIELTGRIGTDVYNEHRKYLYPQYSRDWSDLYKNASNGTFWEQFCFESETNADLLLKIDRKLSKELTLFSTIGANSRYTANHYATTSGTNLIVPDFFSTSNFKGEPNVDFTKYEKETYSLFGSVNLGFRNWLFLDLSLRNDWSSTLPKGNWSYLYPSANLGFIFTDALKMESSLLSYGKIRAGFAMVGNDTDPYQLNTTFQPQGTTFNGVNLFGSGTTLLNGTLKPEETNSIEIGGEFKFFDNRAGLDITLYHALTYNQLLKVDIPNSSGYSAWMKNAGSILNRGIELQLYGTPIAEPSGFKWEIMINWSMNRNEVQTLDDGLNELEINNIYYGTSLMAFPGKEWGTFYGKTFKRNEKGQIVVDQNGMPITSTTNTILGNVNPDWTGGLRNSLTYKNLRISALVDCRKGGEVFSMSKADGQHSGLLEITVKDGVRENGMVVDGVYEAGAEINGVDVSGETNQTLISARSYWRNSRNWAELSLFDGSYIKLREVTVSYSLPKTIINNIGIQAAEVSVFAHNLALLYTDKSNNTPIDPDVSFGGTVAGTGTEIFQLPSTRTVGCKLTFNF
jgi:TonB-linked SusC/RagA family outer membrane protein